MNPETETETETREPFDLERALAGEAVETRQGKKVTNFTYFPNAQGHQLCAEVHSEADSHIITWPKTGKFKPITTITQTFDYDLFMSPKPKVIRYLWVDKLTGVPFPKMRTENELIEDHDYDDDTLNNFIKIPGSATEFPE